MQALFWPLGWISEWMNIDFSLVCLLGEKIMHISRAWHTPNTQKIAVISFIFVVVNPLMLSR